MSKSEHLQCPNCGGAVFTAPIERRGRGYWRPGQHEVCQRCGCRCVTAIRTDARIGDYIDAVYAGPAAAPGPADDADEADAQDDLQSDAVGM